MSRPSRAVGVGARPSSSGATWGWASTSAGRPTAAPISAAAPSVRVMQGVGGRHEHVEAGQVLALVGEVRVDEVVDA